MVSKELRCYHRDVKYDVSAVVKGKGTAASLQSKSEDNEVNNFDYLNMGILDILLGCVAKAPSK